MPSTDVHYQQVETMSVPPHDLECTTGIDGVPSDLANMKQATRSSPVQRSEPQNASPPFAPLLQIAYGATAAMLATITVVSLIVYEWVGLAFLRSGGSTSI